MTIRPRPAFLQLFFIMRGSAIPRIAPQVSGFAVCARLVALTASYLAIDFDPLAVDLMQSSTG